MESSEFLPPGKHPDDPPPDTDPIARHVQQIKGNLVWIDQYRLNIEHYLRTDPPEAERELVYLRDATKAALKHMRRLTQLLLAGYTIDPKKKIPRDLELPPETS